jgi:hypothetical protein
MFKYILTFLTDNALGKLVVNSMIVFLIFILTMGNYTTWSSSNQLKLIDKELRTSQTQTETLSRAVDYLNSPESKELSFKIQGYQYKNEEVYQLKHKEQLRDTNNQLDFVEIPETDNTINTLDRWLTCLGLKKANNFWYSLEEKKQNVKKVVNVEVVGYC